MRKIQRRDFLKSVGAAAVAGPAALSHRVYGAGAIRKPNVLLIVSDDQRHDTIAALGNDHIVTPSFDRLAREGFAFTSARVMGSQQGAVCIPARAMLHTGRTLFHVPDNMGRFPLLGQTLQAAGYNAFACGKWHNGSVSFNRAFNGGKNIFFGGMHDQYKTPVHDYSPWGDYAPRDARVPGKFSSELFADAAVQFIESQRSTERPFYCYLAFTSPHDPRTPPPPYDKMYDPAKMPLPVNFLPRHPFDNGDLNVRDEGLAPMPRTPEDTKQQLCDYYGMISSQDAQIGQVLAALEKIGQLENTLIVCTGDHGLAIGSHGLFGKQNVYEHSVRIPMIIRGPGIPKSARSHALVYGLDIFPTLCQLLQVEAPNTIEGKSLADLINGKKRAVRDSCFHAYVHRRGAQADTQQAVHDSRWKYIRYDVMGQRREQLFDLLNDPEEIHDLSTDAAAAREIPRLGKLLERWRSELA